MTFSANRVKKYIEAVSKRLNASLETGKDFVSFIDENSKTIIGFYFEISNDVFTLTDLYYNGDYYPLKANKMFSLNKMIKAVEKAERAAIIQANVEEQFADYEDSLA